MAVAYGFWMVLLCFAADVPAVSINGKAVNPEAWAFLTLTRGGDENPTTRAQLIDQLIERELMRGYLEKLKVVADADVVDLRLIQLEELIRRRGSEPADVFAKLGLSVEQLRKELALGVAWEQYVEQQVTPKQLADYFEEHRSEFDGTRVKARQIFRKAMTDAEVVAAEKLLSQLRAEIAAGKVTFAQAAVQYSQSPTAKAGGDVGWIVGVGQLPLNVALVALALQPEELSQPVRSPFGVHLVYVSERQPGQLSLEDVRPEILKRQSPMLWSAVVAQLRQSTRIVRPAP
ncbi:hypothetical protein GC163_21570 [bacterium]|nr:hypothetical protein [bacterium]